MANAWNDPSEKMIENSILQWLNAQPGVWAFKYDVKGTWDTQKKIFRKAGKYVEKGGSDILGLIKMSPHKEEGGHAVFFSIEVKTPEGLKKFYNHPGEHEKRQDEFMRRVSEHGGLSFVVSSLSDVIGALGHLIKKEK